MVVAFSLAALAVAAAGTPLEKNMERMKKAYRELSLGLEKPQDGNQSAYVSLAETIRAAALESRDLVPALAANLPPDKKEAMVKAYRADMEDFVGSVDTLIGHLKAGNWAESRKDMANMKNEMKDSHREFRKPD